jgi:hypothetical protein
LPLRLSAVDQELHCPRRGPSVSSAYSVYSRFQRRIPPRRELEIIVSPRCASQRQGQENTDAPQHLLVLEASQRGAGASWRPGEVRAEAR